MNELRNSFNSAEIAEITKYPTVLSIVKTVNLNQKYINPTAERHNGDPMPIYMTRIKLNFYPLTGKADFKLFDKFYTDNNPKHEEFKDNGNSVDVNNIHKAISSHFKLRDVVDLSFICT